jgi:outer membrane protein assembly factor BamB
MKKAFILLALISASFASLLWQFGTDGPISSKPLVFQSMVLVASEDGKLYALDPATGAKKWQALIGGTPRDLILADNAVYIPTAEGKMQKVGAGGAVQWNADLEVRQYNVSIIYGSGVASDVIAVTANNGVYLLEKNGSVRSRIMFFNDSILTAPAVGADYIIFGKGDELYRLSRTGQVQWKTRLADGKYWLSKPVVDGSVVYVGALDGKMHAFVTSNGLELWDYRTDSWVAGTPLVKDGVVYFGSNDGAVHAVESGGGNAVWSAKTQLAVISQPETGIMGGGDVIFTGSTDRNIYALSRGTGEAVWMGTASGAVGSPLFYQNRVIFGARDGKVYAYSTERACSITSPLDAEIIGVKELEVRGKYVSEAGGAKVLVKVDDGEWQEANATDMDWVLYVNPQNQLVSGLNVISCQVADLGGSEEGSTYTTVTVTHDPTTPISDLVVRVSPDIIEGKPFTVYVNDADDSSPVDRFALTIDGKVYQSDKNFTLTMTQAGTYKAIVKKIGFRDATVNVVVNPSGISPLYMVLGAALIITITWLLWTRVLKQRFGR